MTFDTTRSKKQIFQSKVNHHYSINNDKCTPADRADYTSCRERINGKGIRYVSVTRTIAGTSLTDGRNTVSYASRMIRRYIEWLEKQDSPEILDVGPVCETTINFFLPRVNRIHISDIFQWLHRNGSDTSLPRELNYQPNTFDAVHLWDCIDHIQERTAPALIQALHSIVKPGGSLLITANEELFQPWPLNSFAVMEDCQVVLRPQPHIDLPFSHWKNRDIIHLLNAFTLKESFVYTCGIREFLFRKE